MTISTIKGFDATYGAQFRKPVLNVSLKMSQVLSAIDIAEGCLGTRPLAPPPSALIRAFRPGLL
jgi:hypothetical protein